MLTHSPNEMFNVRCFTACYLQVFLQLEGKTRLKSTFSHQYYFTSVPRSCSFSGSQQVLYFGSDHWLNRYEAQANSLSTQLPRKPRLQSFTSEKVLSFAMRLSKLGNLQLLEKSRYKGNVSENVAAFH